MTAWWMISSLTAPSWLTPSWMASLPGVSAAAAELWLAGCWQGLLVVGMVALCLRVMPGCSAGQRSTVWVGVLGLLAGLHFFPFFGGVEHGVLSLKAGQQTAWMLDGRWALVLAGVWLSVSLVRGLWLVIDLLRVRSILLGSTPLSLHSGPTPVFSSRAVTRPCAAGYLHPRILLPAGLAEELSAAELQQVLLHEAEHLRRNDHWINLLQKCLLVLFPLNPAMLIVERRLCLERELACDDQVMRLTGARKAYAACLARIAEHRLLGRGAALVLGAWDRRPALVKRVERILHSAPVEMIGWRAHTSAAAVFTLAVVVAVGLTGAPAPIRFEPGMSTTANGPAGAEAAAATPASVDPEQYGRVQLVKATMPLASGPVAAEQVRNKRAPLRRKARTTVSPASRSFAASHLRQAEVAWTVARRPAPAVSESFFVPAMLYVVPTPQGWVVIQL